MNGRKPIARVPIYKSVTRTEVYNYRPISLLSIIPNLFELIVYDLLFASLKNSIMPAQHGFFRGRSVETNLLTFTQYLFDRIMEECSQVDAIYT